MTNEEAIKLIDDMGAEPFDNYGLDDVSMALYMAKKALEERPTGEWILHGMIYYCSNCGHDCGESGDNFCGNCGAKMKGKEE